MTKIVRARVRTTLLMGTLVLLAAPAYTDDMPHFTLAGTATAASGVPSPVSLLVAFDLRPLGGAGCGDGGGGGTCRVRVNNTLYQSSMTMDGQTLKIVSGWGVLEGRDATLLLTLTMYLEYYGTVELQAHADLWTDLIAAVGFLKLAASRFTLEFPPQHIGLPAP